MQLTILAMDHQYYLWASFTWSRYPESNSDLVKNLKALKPWKTNYLLKFSEEVMW